MNEELALAHMISPGMKRRNAYMGGIIQIWTTRKCDKACFGCTQGSNLAGSTPHITVEQFEQAVVSLKDYFGVVGVFGGNPAVHPQFPELCEVLRAHIPKHRCGLWCNKLFGHGPVARETFNPAHCNLNVHMDKRAYWEFRRDWPEARVFGLSSDSRHSPPYVSMKDMHLDEETRWSLISKCDINHNWSAMIGVFRGELRGYFCEIAGAMSMLHQSDSDWEDTGLPVEPGWWKNNMLSFRDQVRQCCHNCGVPLRGKGELACSTTGREQVSSTHLPIYQLKKKDRNLEVVNSLDQVEPQSLGRFTDYLSNAKR